MKKPNNSRPTKFPVNSLYLLAERYRNSTITEEEIMQNNETERFFYELEQTILNDQAVNIQFMGEPGTGKSTANFAVMRKVHKMLQKHGKTWQKEPFGMQNIVRDQQDYSFRMRDPKTEHMVLATDEFTQTAEGGINSTAEKSLLMDFSNLCRSRYVHLGSCSPQTFVDPNSSLLLEIPPGAKRNGYTLAKLSYRYIVQSSQMIQLVGYVTINVMPIIRHWLHIKDLFYKPVKTPEEEKYIEEYAKRHWYVRYAIRKKTWQDIVTKEGIINTRELHYSRLRFRAFQQFKQLVIGGYMPSMAQVEVEIKTLATKQKLALSMYGLPQDAKLVHAVLRSLYELHKIKKSIENLDVAKSNNMLSGPEHEYRKKLLMDLLYRQAELANSQEKRWKYEAELLAKYELQGTDQVPDKAHESRLRVPVLQA